MLRNTTILSFVVETSCRILAREISVPTEKIDCSDNNTDTSLAYSTILQDLLVKEKPPGLALALASRQSFNNKR